jgi:hypothetical protein
MKVTKIILALFALLALGFFSYRYYAGTASTQAALFDQEENKLWLHRIYDHKRANALLPDYSGLETDIIYDSARNVFDIRHNEADEYQYRTLDDFWGNIEHASDYYYWLDFKNVDQHNLESSKTRLTQLIQKHGLMNRVIVESWRTKELNEFAQAGIHTSYWIPHFDIDDNQLCQEKADEIRDRLFKYDLNALSAHYRMVPFLEKHFSDCNVHIWTNGLLHKKDKNEINALSQKPNIKVILVDLDEAIAP